ncbi:MAG TPA: hypothetical protein VIK22_09025 [Candidatus Anoxymicrobiaceae bacterium]
MQEERESWVEIEEYLDAEDLFYWMEEPLDSDIPLSAIWIDIPMGCRFCC